MACYGRLEWSEIGCCCTYGAGDTRKKAGQAEIVMEIETDRVLRSHIYNNICLN